MSLALVRASRGLASINNPIPSGATALGRTARVLPLSFATQNLSLVSIANYDDTLGELTCTPNIYSDGIRVQLTATIPDDYRRHLVILRGKLEYKRRLDQVPLKVVYEDSSVIPENVDFVDTDIELGVHYYYSVLMMVGSSTEDAHYEYNPNTGFSSAYSFTNYGHARHLFNRLPDDWHDTDSTGFTERYLQIFGRLLDSLKTDIDTNILTVNDPYAVHESELPMLGAKLGLHVNRELRETKQREEIDSYAEVTQIKGRDQAIRFLVQLVSGWEVNFENGWRRVFYTNNLNSITPSYNDPYTINHVDLPERLVEDEVVGSSNGTATQEFALANS